MQIKGNKSFTYQRTVTQKVIDAILADIAKGGTRKHSAEANGISRRHFHNLVAQGVCDIDAGKIDTIHANLVLSLRKIELKEIQECRRIIKDNEKGHKGAEWTLEHAYWRDFGSSSEVKELAEELELLRAQLKAVKDDSEEIE